MFKNQFSYPEEQLDLEPNTILALSISTASIAYFSANNKPNIKFEKLKWFLSLFYKSWVEPYFYFFYLGISSVSKNYLNNPETS